MNIATLIVLIVLAVLVVLAVRRIRAKKLLSTCGGNCSACAGSCPHKMNH